MSTQNDERQASAGQVERPVRPLIERLRDAAQGVDLGADGMGWSPDPALMREAADELEDRAEAAEDWKERWRHERTHGCPHWGNHTSDGRERVCWYGGLERFERDEKTIRAMVKWLEENQPDVFKRGMWDAINSAAA